MSENRQAWDQGCVLALEGITKEFPGVKALDHVTHSFYAGRIHAIVGENGAGKSTLMNIIDGNYQPTSGKLFMEGQEVVMADPLHAQRMGIAMMHQEGSLLKHLSITENIFLNKSETWGLGIIKSRVMRQKALEYMKLLEIDGLEPETPVRDLSIGQRRLVEVAKALASQPKILILDEPTASLTESDTEILLRILKRQREAGLCILYISHRLEEIFSLADDVTVLRDGKKIGTWTLSDIDIDQLIARMVGRTLNAELEEIQQSREEVRERQDAPYFRLEGLCMPGRLYDVSLEMYRGEVLGLAGLIGSGRSETAEAIMGYRPCASIRMELNGRPIANRDPADAIRNGIVMVPEDRREKGIFDRFSVMDNLNLVNLRHLKGRWLLSGKKQEEAAARYCRRLNIRTPSLEKAIGELTGGNQQEVILARYLSMEEKPQLLILDEPTYGIDVGTKAEIYKIIRDLQKEGISILLISSDMNELMTLSSRILVFYEGRITGELGDRDAFDQQTILNYASGMA